MNCEAPLNAKVWAEACADSTRAAAAAAAPMKRFQVILVSSRGRLGLPIALGRFRRLLAIGTISAPEGLCQSAAA
ncbi:hypothetical protein STAQ_36340 [Allostella sp. ATCC 35155]|nr:hypothetical protein STAQ_36340 [Stella sp. ATCC 35155]